MTDTYTVVGDALYDFARLIDITSVEPAGWAHTYDRIFEPEEVTTGGYPVLMVLPAEDEATPDDNRTDDDRVVFWVQVCDSVANTRIEGEGKIRAIADLVRNAIRAERVNATPFGIDTYDVRLSGQWGWDTERGERFYRCIVTVYIAQDL